MRERVRREKTLQILAVEMPERRAPTRLTRQRETEMHRLHSERRKKGERAIEKERLRG